MFDSGVDGVSTVVDVVCAAGVDDSADFIAAVSIAAAAAPAAVVAAVAVVVHTLLFGKLSTSWNQGFANVMANTGRGVLLITCNCTVYECRMLVEYVKKGVNQDIISNNRRQMIIQSI